MAAGRVSVTHNANAVSVTETSVTPNRIDCVGQYKPAQELGDHGRNRVPLPGDAQYTGVCHIANGQWEAMH